MLAQPKVTGGPNEVTMSNLPKSVTINDDTMREGLQIESAKIPVEAKLRLLDALGETGAKVISIGSFAHPKWTPQMACIDEIASRFVPKPGVIYTAAVFNKHGYDRADEYYPKIDVRRSRGRHASHVELCDSFARRNYNRSQAQQIAALDATVAAAREAGAEKASVSIGNPFGSNFEGPYTHKQRMDLLALMIGKWQAAGIKVTRVSLLEAMGWNLPISSAGRFWRSASAGPRDRLPSTCTISAARRSRAITKACNGVREFDTRSAAWVVAVLRQQPRRGTRADGRLRRHVPRNRNRDGYKLDKLIEAVAIAEEVVGHPPATVKVGPRPPPQIPARHAPWRRCRRPRTSEDRRSMKARSRRKENDARVRRDALAPSPPA